MARVWRGYACRRSNTRLSSPCPGWQDGYRVPREFRFPGAARANVSDCFAALHRSIVGFYTVGRQTGFAGTYLR